MFDYSRLQKSNTLPRRRITKRPSRFQLSKRLERHIPIPRKVNSARPLPFKPKLANIGKTKPERAKPTPTFTSKPTPTFNMYMQPEKKMRLNLSRLPVAASLSARQLKSKNATSPWDSPEEKAEEFVPIVPEINQQKILARQKRRFIEEEDEYKPVLKKRKVRRAPTSKSPKPQEANYKWRDTSTIPIPDIMIVTADQWPSDDETFDETIADVTNEAYYVRHYRAEMRERIFYNKLQKWRDKEMREHEQRKSDKLTVADRPRGPWQVKLPKSAARGPQHVPEDIINLPRFNYSWKYGARWTQPVHKIRRIDTYNNSIRTRSSKHVGGKDLSSYAGWAM